LTETVKIIECPRDAWQGLPEIIPTSVKIEYLLKLASAGFKHIDAVSFVSPDAVKQMSDSEEVMKGFLAGLPAEAAHPEIIGIVVNEKGLQRALATPGVTTLGYPYSISAYFRRANANMSRAESRALSRPAALAYSTESMRLTTRLMQVASWLLLQRAVNEGELTSSQAQAERVRVKLSRQEYGCAPEVFEQLPSTLRSLSKRSLRIQERVIHLDQSLVVAYSPEPVTTRSEVAFQVERLRAAFSN